MAAAAAAATLRITSSPSLTLVHPKHQPTTNRQSLHRLDLRRGRLTHRPSTSCSYKVVIEHEGQATELDVDPDETILSKALDSGLSVPHDCKLGVCMTCPAKLLSGSVDQSEGMLSEDVIDRGYSLLCVSYPQSDCHIKTIAEEELLALQLATVND